MATKKQATVIQFEFDITAADMAEAMKSSRIYNEDDGIVAIAFKRQFPDEPFICAHGDYYIGLGKGWNDYDRYTFDNESTETIGRIFKDAGFTLPVTVRANRFEER